MTSVAPQFRGAAGHGESNGPVSAGLGNMEGEREMMDKLIEQIKADREEKGFLIYKSGRGFYRPDSCGYTAFKFDAGRYSENEACAITFPNGEDGPRDGMFFKHEDDVSDYPSKRIEELESRILADAEALKAADELAWCVNALLRIARQYGEDSTVHELTRVALAAYQATRGERE